MWPTLSIHLHIVKSCVELGAVWHQNFHAAWLIPYQYPRIPSQIISLCLQSSDAYFIHLSTPVIVLTIIALAHTFLPITAPDTHCTDWT